MLLKDENIKYIYVSSVASGTRQYGERITLYEIKDLIECLIKRNVIIQPLDVVVGAYTTPHTTNFNTTMKFKNENGKRFNVEIHFTHRLGAFINYMEASNELLKMIRNYRINKLLDNVA